MILPLVLPLALGLAHQAAPKEPEPPTEVVKAPEAPAPARDAAAKRPATPAPVPAPQAAPAPAAAQAAPAQGLGFASFRLPYTWNAMIPIQGAEVDGLRIESIFFNKREANVWPLRGADFGTRAQVKVTNTSSKNKIPGFAVAVFDAEDRLVGVATGGTKVGSVGAGTSETFDLNFHQVLERLPKGTTFVLSVELTN
ncbi:hypothetical protein [Mesoterricola sediminis]|uniref:Uncharacterized protein n=1 Tax=Mesoterricola sediminis TaxID=2927980 RepID=A0AA48KEF1_9BACT|nr:hypothetical protein [Mesoterricola sediminis]BDU75398.1 hypothetical protein METESE_03560 [Mesoterricola sediminis]